MSIKHRRGRFSISSEIVYECGDIVRQIMGSCTIIRVDYRPANDELDYLAISPLFNEIPFGQRCPEYVFSRNEDGEIRCEAVGEVTTADLKKMADSAENYRVMTGEECK